MFLETYSYINIIMLLPLKLFGMGPPLRGGPFEALWHFLTSLRHLKYNLYAMLYCYVKTPCIVMHNIA